MKIYKAKEFASLIGVTTKTLERWDKSNKLDARRMPGGSIFYTEEDLSTILHGQKEKLSELIRNVNEVDN